jgi:hypothetical protein
MSLVKTNSANLQKDPKTGVLINTDKGAFKVAIAARQKILEIKAMKEDIKTLKAEIVNLWKVIDGLRNSTN